MTQSSPAQAPEPATGLARLFNVEKFRRRAFKVYRVAGPVVLAWFAVGLLQSAGLLGQLSADALPGWAATIYALLTLGLVMVTPLLFIVATVGGLALKDEWRFAAPLWLFSTASGLFLVTVFMASSLALEDQRQVWTVSSLLLLASATWATVVGYRRP